MTRAADADPLAADEVRRLAAPLNDAADLDPLLDRVGDARFVLLGEASHGTHEYYTWRAAISRRLIVERGFSFVAVEGDWPDCYEVTRSVKHASDAPAQPIRVLERFDRWPTWMWANTDVAEFTAWLRDHNAGRPRDAMVGFYGLDVYSLWDSLRAILRYLEEHEPEHVDAALEAWRCFEPYREDPQEYAWATRIVPASCEHEVVELLAELCRGVEQAVEDDREATFDAEQNAQVAAGAERYYRAMIRGGPESWNVRDTHMADTLDRLTAHHGPGAKAIVWEHNTHVGDARATDMAADGLVNLGQLVRERHGSDDVVLVGFGGYAGEVVAADAWGAPMQRLPVPPARDGSLEDLLHAAGCGRALFVWHDEPDAEWLASSRDHRAIGVVYHPQRERWGNYVSTILGRRYDAFCFFSETNALDPLHVHDPQPGGEPETYPSGH